MKPNQKVTGRILGFMLAIAGSVMYGLNPLFCLPLYEAGYTPMVVLFWRYLLATLLLALAMAMTGKPIKIPLRPFLLCSAVGILFALSSIALFVSFTMIDAGIASVILFVYPIFVAIISALFFRERLSVVSISAIFLAFLGIFLLRGPQAGTVGLVGFFLALLSGLCYAVYLVWVNRSVLKGLPAPVITLYAILSGTVMMGLYLLFTEGIAFPASAMDFACFAGLAIFPTVGSLLTVTKAIHLIGSTPASAMGALEPVTALVITVLFFGGELTFLNIVGIVIVFVAVLCIILEKK